MNATTQHVKKKAIHIGQSQMNDLRMEVDFMHGVMSEHFDFLTGILTAICKLDERGQGAITQLAKAGIHLVQTGDATANANYLNAMTILDGVAA